MTPDPKLLSFAARSEWRAWLIHHHAQAAEAILRICKKGAPESSVSLPEAQEEALCFGWVDVSNKRIDRFHYSLRFTPRRAGSAWSMTNIRRVEKLIQAGLMTEAGLEKVTEAKHNGQWQTAIQVSQTGIIPPDLAKALRSQKGGLACYRTLPDSRKRQILRGLLTAKSPATRQRRIQVVVQAVAED